MLFERLHLPEPSMWHFFMIIIFNYIEFQAPQNCSSLQPCTTGRGLFWGQKQDVLPFKIQKYIHNYQICDVNDIKKTQCQINITKYIMKIMVPWSCHWCYRLTKVFYFVLKNHTDDITCLSPSYFLKICEKGPCFFSVMMHFLIYLMISYEAFSWCHWYDLFIVRELYKNNKKKSSKWFKRFSLVSIPWLTACDLIPCCRHFVKCIFHEMCHWCTSSWVTPVKISMSGLIYLTGVTVLFFCHIKWIKQKLNSCIFITVCNSDYMCWKKIEK